MITLENLLNSNSYLMIDNPTSKKMVFDTMCIKAFETFNIDKNQVLNDLVKREKIGTTTIGNGISIPHVQNNFVTKPVSIVTILSKGLDFDAIDKVPVDIIVFLILPEANKSENLQILAQVSRLLRNSDIINKLRGSKSEDSAFAIISQFLKDKAA